MAERETYQTLEGDIEAVEYFAKNAHVMLSNPNENIAEKATAFSRYTKEQIMQFMQAPSSSAKQLRDASIYMADVSSQYNRLLSYYANLYTWAYTVSPVAYSPSSKGAKTAAGSYWDHLHVLEKLNLPHMAPIVMKTALREGVFYGIIWEGNNILYVQQIPPDYCKLTNIVDGTWQYSVDMTKIKAQNLILYPPEFTRMYENYKTGDKLRWQPVPEKISFCIKADESVTAYSIPPFASTLGLLYDIENYKAIQKTGAEIENYKLLNMKIPLRDDGTPLVDWELAHRYYDQLCGSVADYIGVSISPMDVKDFTFERSGAAQNVDIVSRAEDNYWTSNGTSALLHGSTAGKTAGTLKLSIKADEAFMWPMVKQIELLVNKILRERTANVQKYKINVLPATVFNTEDLIKVYKEGATLGVPGTKAAYAALLNTASYDILGMRMIEDQMLNADDWTPLKSSYNGGNTAGSKDPGRPTSNDEDLSESGEDTRAADSNANR